MGSADEDEVEDEEVMLVATAGRKSRNASAPAGTVVECKSSLVSGYESGVVCREKRKRKGGWREAYSYVR